MKTIKNTRKDLEIKAAQLIAKKIIEYAKTQDKVVLGIVGGTSILGILSLLKHQRVPWHKLHIFMVDERVTALDDPQSNYKNLYDNLIEYLTKQHLLPSQNAHPYIYFNLPPEEGINAYRNELREISHCFDIVLLSSGEDGHVSSLFPNHNSIKDPSESFILVNDSPKPPKTRISASRKLIAKSKTALLLFFGEQKRKAYERFLDREISFIDCPAKLINDIKDSYVFTDLK